MAINGRNKGAQGEREFATLLRELGFPDAERNLSQSRDGGGDILIQGLHASWLIEVKRRKNRVLRTSAEWADWWQHLVQNAARDSAFPMLAFRADRTPWELTVRARDIIMQPVVGYEHQVGITPELFQRIC